MKHFYLENEKGQRLFMFVMTNSNEFNSPFIKVCTWEKATELFEESIKDRDDETWLIRKIQVNQDQNRMNATLLCNHKGWGADFMRCIEVRSILA